MICSFPKSDKILTSILLGTIRFILGVKKLSIYDGKDLGGRERMRFPGDVGERIP